jgi:CubicO group peptidase (beta-lactamase class C family)
MRLGIACLLVLTACAHSAPPPQTPAPSDEAIIALYQAKDWVGLGRACERRFTVDHRSDAADCVARAWARQARRDDAIAWLERAVHAGVETPIDETDPDFATLAGDTRFHALAQQSLQAVRDRNTANGVGSGLVASSPQAEGIDQASLDRLLDAAKQASSSSVVILRHGRVVLEWHADGFSQHTETMSATKAVASLAVGALMQDGKITSIDAPMTTWFPEWKDGIHDAVTLRHVLSHTSNLDAPRMATAIYESGDATRYVLGLPMAGPAGAAFFYNNAAVNLIPALVQRVTGQSLEAYVRAKLFTPMGIRDIVWQRDGKGMPFAMSGLQIHAIDFAKLGQLVLQHGVWDGKPLVPAAYIAELARPAQTFDPTSGLLWWIGYPENGRVLDDAFFTAARANGSNPDAIAKLEPLRNQEISEETFFAKLAGALGPSATDIWMEEFSARKVRAKPFTRGEADELSARGSFDQLLLVFPSRDLVVARFTQSWDESHYEASSFPQLDRLARALVSPSP